MRINLTKKDLVNIVYMQIGFSKNISENLINEFFSLIISNLIKEKKLKISNFGTFLIRKKKSRIGRNPKTKENKIISNRNVILFKPSKEFKIFINLPNISLRVLNVIFLIVRINIQCNTNFALKYLEIFFNYVKSKNFSC